MKKEWISPVVCGLIIVGYFHYVLSGSWIKEEQDLWNKTRERLDERDNHIQTEIDKRKGSYKNVQIHKV